MIVPHLDLVLRRGLGRYHGLWVRTHPEIVTLHLRPVSMSPTNSCNRVAVLAAAKDAALDVSSWGGCGWVPVWSLLSGRHGADRGGGSGRVARILVGLLVGIVRLLLGRKVRRTDLLVITGSWWVSCRWGLVMWRSGRAWAWVSGGHRGRRVSTLLLLLLLVIVLRLRRRRVGVLMLRRIGRRISAGRLGWVRRRLSGGRVSALLLLLGRVAEVLLGLREESGHTLCVEEEVDEKVVKM